MHDVAAEQRSPEALPASVGSRLRALLAPRHPPHHRVVQPRRAGDPDRHHEALTVLTAARAVIQRGWIQDAWYVLRDSRGGLRIFGSGSIGRFDPTEVVQACLVGAVVQAAWQQSPDPERSHPAVDQLWFTLQEERGFGGPLATDRICSPAVRQARVRDLARWNDRPGRTREDVLRLLDDTMARMTRAKDAIGSTRS